MNYQEAFAKLEKYGQLHVLKYYNELTNDEQVELISQIKMTDFSVLKSYNQDRKNLKEGKIAAVLLAGGMGTRLGVDIPKGMYDIGITKPLYIFEKIINNIIDVVRETNTWIQLFIMTSDINYDTTIKFFKDNNYFGYNYNYITFFLQEMSPSTDYNGKIYMEFNNKMSTSPNGNGGWFTSMTRCGLLDTIHDKGIEWINVFSVDNVLQRIVDPCFVGATIVGNYDVGAKVVKKSSPDEKVGVICMEDGKPSMIEYYEMTDKLIYEKDEDGDYVYNYGVILNYLFKETKLEEITNNNMPIHLAKKKISFMDENLNQINPEEPNGYKYEILVLDMIHRLDSCLAFEVMRNKEFAPIKNKIGIDSVESARVLLEENGTEL